MAEMNRQMEAGNVQLAWHRTQEEYLARIDKLRLIDDDFFSEALDGKIEAVEYILQTVLERNDIVVVETKAQVEYKSATKRSIRLDIKAVDRAGARRARFHGSMIDRELLGKGKDFDELPESFVIFITENDKYARGVPIYHIERRIEEHDNALFGDGLHILYVNGEYQDVETPVGRLMHDFYCTKSEDMYSKVLADEVKYLKETEGGRARMCRVLDEMCEEVAKETAERVEKETAERVEKETAERVEKETAERVEKETAERVEKETAERVEKETAERVERETAERVAKEKAKETARMLLELNKLSHEEISESTGLSIEVVEELAAQKTA